MSGATFTWRSKKQTCVALSTAEAEYNALSPATQEALWMKQMLTNLSVNVEKPIILFTRIISQLLLCRRTHSFMGDLSI